MRPGERKYLASMGIYLFVKDVLFDLLDHEQFVDFGREVFPHAIGERRVYAHLFDGYWEDIGTIESFYRANLALTDPLPAFNFYDSKAQVFTHPRFLPPSKIQKAQVERSILAEGSIVDGAEIAHSIIGLRTIVREGAVIRDSVIMGADYYEADPAHCRDVPRGAPSLGIGRNTRIRNAIVDKNARIGDRCVIENAAGVREADCETHVIRDGIIVIPRKAVLPPGTVV
jgi:glucose-1-phosphate adenylyltransferase